MNINRFFGRGEARLAQKFASRCSPRFVIFRTEIATQSSLGLSTMRIFMIALRNS